MPTERTVEEAEDYIVKSIHYWKSKGLEKRIISLSNWAECWRVRGESTETASKIKILKNGILNLQRVIENNKKVGIDTDGLEKQREEMQESLTDLEYTFNSTPKLIRKPYQKRIKRTKS